MQDSNSGAEIDSTGENGSVGESESSFGSQNSKGTNKNEATTDLKGHGSSWTDQEELALLEALKVYKWGDWEAMQAEIKSKTLLQVKSKIKNLQSNKSAAKVSHVRKDIIEIISKNKKNNKTLKNPEDLNDESSEEDEIVEKDNLRSKRQAAGKTTIAKKSPAKSPAKSPPKKRNYNRAKKPSKIASGIVPVNSGEDVSIVSSSSSEKGSINIMSSSSSSQSIPSVSSVKSRNSRKSEKSVSKSSADSLLSVSSVESNISDSPVPDWVKESCPAIFSNKTLAHPVTYFKNLKLKMVNVLADNPQFSANDLKNHALLQRTSMKALTQMMEIMRRLTSRGDDENNNLAVINEAKTAFSKDNNSDDMVSSTPTGKKSKPSKKISEEDQIAEDYELLKKLSSISSGRKRKIRSEEGEWIDPDEIEGRVISHEPANQPNKEKRKRKYVRKDFFSEDGVLSSSEDPFRLIYLNEFSDNKSSSSLEETDSVKAPFRVQICKSALLLMDLHSHLYSSEIIGLLGGSFIKGESDDGSDSVLRIDYAFPCQTAHSTGTQVDVDPLSEMEAGEFFESRSVRMSGWYHSHPNFEPNPSLRDLETQTMYQNLFKNSLPGSDVEPFVGVIVNPYLALTESSSHIECFYVLPSANIPSQERLPYRLPIETIHFDSERFPQLLKSMQEIISRAQNASDRLDMQRTAEPGIKRIDKLFSSLNYHGDLTEDQLKQIQNLFDQKIHE